MPVYNIVQQNHTQSIQNNGFFLTVDFFSGISPINIKQVCFLLDLNFLDKEIKRVNKLTQL